MSRSASVNSKTLAWCRAAYMVEDDLAAGRLVRVLDAYPSLALPISAVYPHRRHLAAKVQAFVDFLATRTTRSGFAARRHL